MTLRLKIMVVTLSLIFISGVATVAAMYAILSRHLSAELIKRGETIARHVASGSLTPLLTEDSVTLQIYTRDVLSQETDLRYLFVLNRDGQVVAHGFDEGFPTDLRDANNPAGGGGSGVSRLMVDGEEVYDIAVPVGGGNLGIVRLGLSAAVVRTGVRQVLKAGVLLIFGIVAVVAVVAVVLDHKVTIPVNQLTTAVRKIGSGSLDQRVEVQSGDEIGDLAEAFNEMMARLQYSHSELVGLNSALEREIAERGEAERRVRNSEAELRTIFESTPVMMALLDGEGNIRRINRTWASTLSDGDAGGGTSGIGAAVRCVHAAASSGSCGNTDACEGCEVRNIVRDTLERGGRHHQAEASIRVSDGRGEQTAHFLVSSTPVPLSTEKMALVSIENVTPLKEAQVQVRKACEDLEAQNEELKKLDVIKNSLIRDVTHELKTPVAKFVMQLEMLKALLSSGAPEGGWKPSVEKMENNLRRQEGVIRNLLDLGRLESGRRSYRIEPVRLDELLSEVVEEFRLLMESRGLGWEKRVEPVEIESDRDMLWHVFSNLMSNAVKFTRNGGAGSIVVSLEPADGGCLTTVRDSGIGLSPEEQGKVFELFYQSSASIEGIGVGLALCKVLVEELGGWISLESEGKGRGSVATVFLPFGAPSGRSA